MDKVEKADLLLKMCVEVFREEAIGDHEIRARLETHLREITVDDIDTALDYVEKLLGD